MLGCWMWVQNVCQYGAEEVAERCRRAGMTDLFFLTKGLAGTTAHHGAYAPHACGRDLLRELTDAAHRRGMRVHAWFTSACDETYKALKPESGRCHLTRGKDRELISLADEGYLAYMEKIIREVCSQYEVDGLHLDYIRYNHLLYGWAEEDRQRYAANGADVAHLLGLMERMFYGENREENLLFEAYRAGDESVHALARTRRSDVVHFARTLTQAAQAENSRLILSAALMPEGAYDDLAFSDLHYGQNYEDMAGLFDLALPMAYSKAYGKDAQWVREVAQGTMRRGLQTLVGLHAYEGGTGPSLRADLEALQDSGAAGACLFREGAFAMGFVQSDGLTIVNALDEPITRIDAGEVQQSVLIRPGEAYDLRTESRDIRIFAGEKEKCIYLSVADETEKAGIMVPALL